MDKNTQTFISRFLSERDDTGRFIVVSKRTGRKYFVEPMGQPKTDWGSIDPATGNLMNKKGWQKNEGSIHPKDSLITSENGFDMDKVVVLEPGISPHAYIDMLDEKYPTLVR